MSRAMPGPADITTLDDTPPVADDVADDKDLIRGRGVSAKARTKAQQNDIEQWERVRAVAERDRRRRGHDTTVRVRHVDPATLRPGTVAPDDDAARTAVTAASLRRTPGTTPADVDAAAARRRASAARADARRAGTIFTTLHNEVLVALADGPLTASELADRLSRTVPTIRNTLSAHEGRTVERTGVARRAFGARFGRPSIEWRLL